LDSDSESFGDGIEAQDSPRQGESHIHSTHEDTRLVNVMVALVCCLQRERSREGCDDNEYMTRVREAVRESCCVMGERVWSDDVVDDALRLMIDTGASTHMTNSRDTLIHGTVVACDVQVVGVGGAPIHITEKGSVSLSVGGRQLLLHDVLLSETAHLGAGPVHEPQVLVGVRKFARDTGLGLSFPADGKTMHVYDGNECIATAETDDEALYVIRRQDLALGVGKTASISEATSFKSFKVFFPAPSGSGENTKGQLGTTARVYPATAQLRARSDSRENVSPPLDVGTAPSRASQKGGDAVREEKVKEEKERVRYTAKERKAYGKLIHARIMGIAAM
jgi:hypothetical protein